MKTLYNDLKNKFVLITGSEGVLGRELVKVFLNQKANLILIDITKNPKEYKEIKNIYYFKIDISEEKEINRLKSKIIKITNKIDVLINNATKTNSLENFFKNFENFSIKTWRSNVS